MDPEAFEQLVIEALEGLPQEILNYLDNVAITIADWPTPDELARAGVASGYTLFGLYEGVPLTGRTTHYGLVPPDKITIFRGPLLRRFRTKQRLREEVRRTIIHEIAHHFGMTEEQIRRLGY